LNGGCLRFVDLEQLAFHSFWLVWLNFFSLFDPKSPKQLLATLGKLRRFLTRLRFLSNVLLIPSLAVGYGKKKTTQAKSNDPGGPHPVGPVRETS
jgi:hypothetical protein